ncbi:MAG TPA: hypothetical protein VGJ13_08315 [Pseudonocardiaceae bacterium]|jgi:hypothetical protein
MTLLAASTNETVFWVLAAAVAAVMVIGVLALVATLLYFLRSVSASLGQLRDAQVDLAQAQSERGSAAPPGGSVAGDPVAPATGKSADPGPGVDDVKDTGQGGTVH